MATGIVFLDRGTLPPVTVLRAASFAHEMTAYDRSAPDEVLALAVKSGQIAGMGLDVVLTEPLPADHVFHDILDRPNVIPTPHVAWASAEATQRLAVQMVDNLEAFMAGQPRNTL